MTLDDAKAAEACELLWRHQQHGTQLAALPEALRPATRGRLLPAARRFRPR